MVKYMEIVHSAVRIDIYWYNDYSLYLGNNYFFKI